MSATKEQKQGLPTLHHLNNSQSQRILWLLEELGIEYNLILYNRNPKTQRAPPELAEVHPLGKAPILVTPEGRVIVETAAIAGYLIRTYNKEGKHASSDYIKDEALTTFAGASLGLWTTLALVFSIASTSTPWPLNYIPKALEGAVQNNVLKVEFTKALTYLESELGNEDWFNREEPGRSDIMLSFPFQQLVTKGWVDVEKEYPKLHAWNNRILERPAWKRGIEKGNGYDLNFGGS